MEEPLHVTIITGASEGIGAELARQIAQRALAGTALVLAARQADKLNALADECRRHGAQVQVAPTDVSVREQCEALVADTMRHFGRIDTLVNNAGISAHALLQEVDAEHLQWYETLFRVNFWGAFWCTHAALPHILQTRGRIVAISSLAGLYGLPGRTAYSSSKFALTGFFEALRAEMAAQGVSVTVVYPGVVDTEIRNRGLNAQGQPLGTSSLKEERMMDVPTCVRLTLRAIDQRRRELVMTRQGRLGRWIKLIAPGLTDSLALKTIKEEFRPGRSAAA